MTFAVDDADSITIRAVKGEVSVAGDGRVRIVTVLGGSSATIQVGQVSNDDAPDKAEPVHVVTSALGNGSGQTDGGQQGAAVVAEPPPQTDWNTTATSMRGRVGATAAYQCPPGGSPGQVWGTDRYTDDSSLCTAAVHNGRISFEAGGSVTVRIEAEGSTWFGSSGRGVTTMDYSYPIGGFTFVPAKSPLPIDVSWETTPAKYRGHNGLAIAVTCPGSGSPGRVWGTGTYTDDSSICTAAVRTGRMSLNSGGTITIKIQNGQQSYSGSEQHGVVSEDYADWAGSFSFS